MVGCPQVSTAYTSTWLAVSSQLGNYRELYGPQVLLQLNIAYFLPSIPLLIVSGLFDKVLEAKLGEAGVSSGARSAAEQGWDKRGSCAWHE